MTRKSNIDAIYRLAPLQEGILFHSLQHPGTDVYLVQYHCTLEGLEDGARWRRAWEACVERHPILRTLFTWEKRDHPLQLVRQRIDLPWQSLDWTDCDEAEQQCRLSALLVADREELFDLEQAPLIRLKLVELTGGRHLFLLSFHHILLDGWSIGLLMAEALALYRALPGEAPLAAQAGQRDYQRFIKWLDGRDTEAARAFWSARLGDYRQSCLLEDALPVAGSTALAGSGVTTLSLNTDLSGRLSRRAAADRVTLNTMLVAAWSLVLKSNCRRSDVVFGTTVSGRPTDLAGAGSIAGLFINTLPLRLSVPDTGQLGLWLREVQSLQVAMQAYHNTPLSEVQRCSAIEPGSALFDTILVFENMPVDANAPPAGATPRVRDEHFLEFSHYPLAIKVEPGDCLKLSAVYRGNRVDEYTADCLLRQLTTVLGQFADDAALLLEDLVPMPAGERRRMEVDWNDAPPPATGDQCVHQVFERVVERHPQRTALVEDGDMLSFAELNEQANRLARYLITRGVKQGSQVAVLMPRSAAGIVSFLGVLKSGASYIPLDADLPPARGAAIWRRFKPQQPLVLTLAYLADKHELPAAGCICLDLERHEISRQSPHNPELYPASNALAYVIYTSGSTGTPKGVMIEHGALVSSTLARLQYYPQQPVSFLLLSSLAVDSSVAGIYWSLFCGATLVLGGHRLEQDMERTGQLIQRHRISHMLCIPSLYQVLLDHGSPERLRSLQTVIVAGEACAPGTVERHRSALPGVPLYNEYGPSECTVWATVAELSRWQSGSPVPIGRPIPGTLAYILDERQFSVPPGVVGELYLGGPGLARGYLDDPARTASAFPEVNGVARPEWWSNQRLYRTGDRARYLPGGTIEFLGRMDNQIKVRGHRVEPEDIEATLCKNPAVQAAAVFLQPSPLSEGASDHVGAKLCALVVTVPGSDADAETLRHYARTHLPGYMVPQILRMVPALPRGPGGKVARRVLADYDRQGAQYTDDAAAPVEQPADTNPTEQILLDIWRQVLDVEDISVNSNFFELGGDSLLSIRVLSRARKAGLELSPDEFFDEPTVAGQARLVAAVTTHHAGTAGPDAPSDLPLSPIQGWFFRHIHSHREQWNQSLALRIDQSVDANTLEAALGQLVQRHEALRLVFDELDGQWHPRLLPELPRPLLRRRERRQLEEAALREALVEEVSVISRGFSLQRGPLFACSLVETAPELQDRLLLCAHHLLVDAESWRILLQDLAALCEAATGRVEPLAAVEYSYSQWLQHSAAYSASDDLAVQGAHWESVLSSAGEALPLDHADGEMRNCNGSEQQLRVSLSTDATERLLRELPSKYNCDLSDALLTGLLLGLLDWTLGDQLHIDVEGHGREQLLPGMDPGQTVGWLTSVHPQLLRRVVGEPVVTTLLRVKDSLRAMPHRGIGYGILSHLRQSGPEGPLAERGPAQVCFNYLGRLDRLAADAGLFQVEGENLGETRAPAGPRAYLLEVNCWVKEGQVIIAIAYSKALHEEATIIALADRLLASLREMAVACSQADHKVYSTSDFPLANLDQGELARIGQLLVDD